MKFHILIAGAALAAMSSGVAPSSFAQSGAPDGTNKSQTGQVEPGSSPTPQADTEQHGHTHAGTTSDQPGTKTLNGQTTSTGATAKPTADYVAEAARSDMYEIRSSELAVRKAQSPAVKQFAQQMIRDHNETSAKLKAALAGAGIAAPPPAQLDARRQAMLDALNGQSGPAFEKAYLDQQTAAHQEALDLHSAYAAGGDNAALKALAAATAPRIQHHFDMVKQIASGKPAPAAR